MEVSSQLHALVTILPRERVNRRLGSWYGCFEDTFSCPAWNQTIIIIIAMENINI